jgi:PAS domain S-box-containing protein
MDDPGLEGPDFAATFDAAPGNYLLLTPDLRISAVSDAYLAATMTRREEIVGRSLFEVFPDNPNDPAATGVRNLHASLKRVLATRRPDRMEVQKYDIQRPASSGGGFEERHWSPLNTPVLGPDGDVRSIIHWVEDVTELLQVKALREAERAIQEEALRTLDTRGGGDRDPFVFAEAFKANQQLIENERRYRFLADAVPHSIWTATPDGSLDYCNARATRYTGRSLEQLRGQGWLDALHADDRARTVVAWGQSLVGGTPLQIEHRMLGADGSARWMLTVAVPDRDAQGRVLQWIGSTTDIHQRILAEEQVRVTQRLQAVGTLAGGMAHEVNNMMAGVLGFGELVLHSFGPEHPQRSDVEEMIKAGVRAADVTRQLLAFSRQQVLKPVVLDACTVVRELGAVLRRLVGSDRRLDIKLPVSPLYILADRTQVEQVLINLAANARDATHTGGIIVVEVDVRTLDSELLRRRGESGLAPGRYVCLSVRDDGEGMSPEVIAKAFDPFFTTKAVGQGTGLGLSTVYGITRQSGGCVHIDSAPGAGASVIVSLPLVDSPSTAVPRPAGVERGRGERILVVEDESMLRSLARRGLEAAGYSVYQAPNGAAALQFLTSGTEDPVDLVLTDVVMPRLNGWQLAEAMAAKGLDMPVLFMSGYSGDEIHRRGVALGNVPLLTKPFTLEALAAAVRKRLDETANRTIEAAP